MEKSELDPKQVTDFVGYQFDLKEGKVRPTLDRWQTLTTKIRKFFNRTDLSSPATHVPLRAINSNRKMGSPRSTTYEAHSVVPQQNWRVPESLEKVIPVPRLLHPQQCAPRSTITPTKTALQLFTDASKKAGAFS